MTELTTTQVYTILVTDDDQYTRQTITKHLQSDGYAVFEAVDGKDTLAQMTAGVNPDLVLLDAVMAARSGFEICQKIKAMPDGDRVIIIIMGNLDDDATIQQAFDCGASDYMLKPIRPALLRQRVRHFLTLREQQEAAQQRREALANLTHDYDYEMRVNPDGTTTLDYISAAYLNALGYSFDDLHHDGWRVLVHPDDMHIAQTRYERLMAGKTDISEFRVVTKGGQIIWIDDRAYPIIDPRTEKITRIYGIGRDVTERRQMEDVLRGNEGRLQTLIENASDIIYSLSFEGEFIYITPNWTEYLGHSLDEVVGKHFESFVHPDDLEVCAEFLRKVVETGEKHRGIEYRVRHKDGSWRWHTSAGALAHDTDGNPLYYVGAAHDITEQQKVKQALAENERRYRIISDTISDYAYSYIVNEDGSLKKDWSTQAFHDITGYTWEEMDADGWERITHPDDFHLAEARYLRLLEGKVDVTEFRIFTKSGEVRWLRDHGHPYWDPEAGRVTHIYGAAQDITQSKRDEELMRQQAEQLRIRNDELDAFAYTVAHDLKNPIASMMGFASLIMTYLDRMSDDKVQEYVGLIMEGGYKLKDIINALLMLAGVNKQELPPFTQIDMAAVVTSVKARLDSAIRESQAVIIEPESWPPALGYAPWVEEIWANYISNAIKYGGAPPRVTLGASEMSDGTIRFWVKDNGEGLTEDEQGHVFTPFTRLSQAKVEGHGLGLSVVHRIVDKLGGQVSVTSEIGTGSDFGFTLPHADYADEVLFDG